MLQTKGSSVPEYTFEDRGPSTSLTEQSQYESWRFNRCEGGRDQHRFRRCLHTDLDPSALLHHGCSVNSMDLSAYASGR